MAFARARSEEAAGVEGRCGEAIRPPPSCMQCLRPGELEQAVGCRLGAACLPLRASVQRARRIEPLSSVPEGEAWAALDACDGDAM